MKDIKRVFKYEFFIHNKELKVDLKDNILLNFF